ncbi:MAG: ABC transporter transmembrane domain-containing protein [Lachnospiraceae bacterium]
MIRFVLRFLRFSGEYAAKLKLSFVLSFIEGMLQSVPYVLIWMALDHILLNTLSTNDVWLFSGILLLSVFARMLLRYWFVALESGTGYEICERERIVLGDKLRHFPMSFFSEGNLGRVTSVITVDLPFIEEMGMDALDKVICGYVTSFIACLLLFSVDWRLGLITVGIFGIAAVCFRKLEKVSKKQSPIRQRQQGELVGSILEYVQGIAVIKSFNMTGEKAKRAKAAIDETRDHSLEFEIELISPKLIYNLCFSLGIALTILMSALLTLWGEMSISMAIALFIFVFSIYTPATAFASLSSQLRIMEAGLDRYEKLSNIPMAEESSESKNPGNYAISFDNVSFAYDDEKILEGVSFTADEKNVTALVGPSGQVRLVVQRNAQKLKKLNLHIMFIIQYDNINK